MPVIRQPLSVNQCCELLGIDPQRFICIEKVSSSLLTIVLEPEDSDGTNDGIVPADLSGQQEGRQR